MTPQQKHECFLCCGSKAEGGAEKSAVSFSTVNLVGLQGNEMISSANLSGKVLRQLMCVRCQLMCAVSACQIRPLDAALRWRRLLIRHVIRGERESGHRAGIKQGQIPPPTPLLFSTSYGRKLANNPPHKQAQLRQAL